MQDNQKDFQRITKQTRIAFFESFRVYDSSRHKQEGNHRHMQCEVILAIHAMKKKFITDTLNRGFQLTSTNFAQQNASGGRL